MRRICGYAATAVAVVIALPAFAGVTVPAQVNFDGTLDTAYRQGDKPLSPAASCSTLTCDAIGSATIGEIDEISSSSFRIVGSGENSFANYDYAYTSVASGDYQIVAQIPSTASWTGNLESYTAFGVAILEGETTGDWVYNCFAPYSGAASVQMNFAQVGDANSVWSGNNVDGAGGQSTPRYVGISYDTSASQITCAESSDGSTWLIVGQDTQALSYSLRFAVFGTSHSTVATTEATLTNIAYSSTIDIYTPSDPGGGGTPTWDTTIPNQNWAQGSAITSINLTGYCSDPEAGAVSYSEVSGLPAGVTLSGTTISGTPSSSGSGTATIRCTDSEPLSADTSFSWTVSSSSGDNFNISTGTSSVNCNSLGAGPGDTITLLGTSRGAITFTNCNGSAAAYITVRNDTTESAQLVISGGNNVFRCTDCAYVAFDGTGKWSGAPAGTCGVSSWPDTMGTTQCGIRVNSTGSVGVKGFGTTTFWTVKGIHLSGGRIDLNDHNTKLADNPGAWRDGIVLTQNYVQNASGEGMYIGSNYFGQSTQDLPLRNVDISYNYIVGSNWDCINLKSAYSGTNNIHHNYGLNCGDGTDGTSTQHKGIAVIESTANVYNNIIIDAGEHGIHFRLQDLESGNYGTMTANYYNNVVIGAGAGGPVDGIGIVVGKSGGTPAVIANVYNNTVVDSEGNGIQGNSSGMTGVLRDNIVCNSGGSNISASQLTVTNNQSSAACSTQAFSDYAGDDLSLTGSSPAVDSATSNAPATDILDVARPQGAADDQGAYEYVP